jgi:glycosyltransferase involved in cell wall biosynthesis
MPDKLRIGFVTIHAADDCAAYSGTSFAMRQALRSHAGVAVVDIDRLHTPCYPLWRAKQAAYWFGFGRRYWMNREPAVVASYAAQVERKLASTGLVDVLMSPGSIPLARYPGPVPTVFWSDATFDCLADFYPEASEFSAETRVHGHRLEHEALRTCTLAVYSSRWAAKSAEKTYGAPQSKLATVSYGANIDPPTGPVDAAAMISRRLQASPRLLFIGSHWQRKGGDLAVALTAELVRRGHPVRLDVVGCAPPSPVPDFVTIHGFIDKRSSAGRERLDGLYRDSHLLVLPTRADCVPMVIAEAYAYGLPVAATAVGGVGSVVDDSVTGRLLPLDADAAAWATAVEGILRPPDRYAAHANAARAVFQRSLNWPSAVDRVVQLLKTRCLSAHAA